MLYVADQITKVRNDTNNRDYSSTSGIPDNDILGYLNEAQEELQGLVLVSTPGSFQYEKIITLTALTEAYSIPDNVYIGERIVSVEYSPTGLVSNYYPIYERGLQYRNTSTGSDPSFYIRRSGQLLLNPLFTRSGATIRVNYERALDSMDIRRGTISARTLSATQLTALTINAATDDATALLAAQYLCVNDQYGNVTMYNIPITSYNDTTGVVTLSAFTFATGETAAVGSYVTVGRYTTTHCKHKDTCQRYLLAYANVRVYGRDSRNDISSMLLTLDEIKKEIVATYQVPDKDDHEIQVSNGELIIDC